MPYSIILTEEAILDIDQAVKYYNGISFSPGFEFVDHVAIAVKQGELDAQVLKYKALGFTELHREEVYGKHQVREVLLQIGAGPNLIQLLEPMSPESPVAKQIEKSGGRGGFAHLAFRVKDINVAYAAMKEMVAYRDARGKKLPVLEWKYVIFNWNDHPQTIQRAIEMAKEIGVDIISFWPTHNPFYGSSWRWHLGQFNKVGVPCWKGREVILRPENIPTNCLH